MPRSWSEIAEQRIRKAEVEGQFKDLAGAGKPLPDRTGDALIDPGLAIGHRIMAENGALPEEVQLRKTLDAAKAAYAEAQGEAARKAAMARIADVQMRLSIAEEARRKFFGT